MPVRDNFSEKVKRTLAGRVGHLCSKPDCRIPTSGPAADEEKSINVGEAAHITAASTGGARYNGSLTAEERSSISNGIWLCATCASLVDKDEITFPIELLNTWKRDAEARAFKALATSEGAPPVTTLQLDEADREFLRNLALPAQDDIETAAVRMQAAAAIDIAAFRNAREWPSYIIPLNLTLCGKDERTRVTLGNVAKAVGSSEGVCFISPPGTGKTTTLVQLADAILCFGRIAGLVPLGEWSDRQESFFEFLVRRNAFSSFRPQHFMQVAYHGRLVLLLDGWNELNSDAKKRALNDLKTLRREFPQLAVVIGTRRQAIPIPGEIIEIEGLSDVQQLEIANKLRGKEGEELVDRAWRTSGIRDLISIPLYLNAMLASIPGTLFPKSKEEILSTFVAQHENAPDKAEILHREVLGFHKNIFVSLAEEMNRTMGTALSDDKARRAISKVVMALQADGQLTTALQPTTVLDVLINTHSLIRGTGNISFQHQQFQEWYASFRVESLMLAAAQGNKEADCELRTEILDWPAWEESIFFACERMSKEHEGSIAVGKAILATLAIDPMLAAEMIYRSDFQSWSPIADQVMCFIDRWHKPGEVDRAFRFMITSGRPEFEARVWPLVSHVDDQISYQALRTARRFRPTVLGPHVLKRLAELPEEIRRRVVSEISRWSGFEGMELAVELAKTDPSPRVVVGILQSLDFRYADRHVREVLQTASDEVWQRIAREGYPDTLLDSVQNTRLAEMRRKFITDESNPIRILYNLVKSAPSENPHILITQLILSPDFPVEDERARWTIENAFEAYPKAVSAGMLMRVIAGLKISFRGYDFLEISDPIDEGTIADAALDKNTPEALARAAYRVMGPKTIGKMIDALFVLGDEFDANNHQWKELAGEEYERLRDAIKTSQLNSFHLALLERAQSERPGHIDMMASLLVRHDGPRTKGVSKLSADVDNRLSKAVAHWAKVMLTDQGANRHQFAHVAEAIEHQACPEFEGDLQGLWEKDFKGHAQELEEVKRTGKRGWGGQMSYSTQYRKAFVAIGSPGVITLMKGYLTDLRFGFDAAGILLEIWRRDHPTGRDRAFDEWHDFSRIEKRRELSASIGSAETHEFSEAIFEVVRNLGRPEKDSAMQRHAINLAKIGLCMPYGVKGTEIDVLFNLPQPYAIKQGLFTAAALAGEILSADMILAAIEELLEVGKREPWRLESSNGTLMTWLELFPFSDRPWAVLGTLALMPSSYRHPHDLNRLVTAVGYGRPEESLGILEALAKQIPKMVGEHKWFPAILRVGTVESAHVILNLICEGKLNGAHGTGLPLSRQLAKLAETFPALHHEIFCRYEKLPDGTAKQILEEALFEVTDVSTVLTIIRKLGTKGQIYDWRLAGVIEKLAVGRRPADDLPGATQQVSVPLTEFRKGLFAMLRTGEREAALAEVCLIEIEKLRDEHGRVSDEPRHPDIASGRAWPKEAEVPAL